MNFWILLGENKWRKKFVDSEGKVGSANLMIGKQMYGVMQAHHT